MKRLLTYLVLCAALLGAACTEENNASTEGTGIICLRIGMDGSRAYDPMSQIIIRIYTSDGTLVRRYTSLDEMPKDLRLIAGGYRVTVEAGDKSTATWTNKSYSADKEFNVVANRLITEEVVLRPVNTGVEVTYDPTVAAKLDMGFTTHVSIGDTFDEEAVTTVPTLEFVSDNATAIGYFLMPAGTTSLSWRFEGEGERAGKVYKTGTIEHVEPAMIYQLKFQYSRTPDGFADISVSVDKREDKHYDDIGFSPQPTIKGDGFQIGQAVGYEGNKELGMNVSSIKNLAKITMTSGSDIYTIYNAADEGSTIAEGISYEKVDDKNGKITLSKEFLSAYTTGVNILNFNMTDIDGGVGKGKLTLSVPGLLETTDHDLWSYTASFRAVVIDAAATNVTLAYRTDGGAWKPIPTTANGDLSYSATLAPTWIESKNPTKKTIYTMAPDTGFRPLKSNETHYEYCVMSNGTPLWTRTLTPEGGNDPIPTLNNSGLSCYTTNNESENNFWGSGNNTTTKSLCTFSSGTQGAFMKPTIVNLVSVFAPGNLFTGTFKMSGTNGTVSFGKKYTYTARPTALSLKYKAKIGTVDRKDNGTKIPVGQPDKGRIYVAIVDWRSRHNVTSGTSAPSGVWDPENGADAVSEGKIIGYGSFPIEGVTPDMTDLSIPIHYYDTVAKPTPGNYTMLISCATSYYGDFLNGCSSNEVYVSDFHWEY